MDKVVAGLVQSTRREKDGKPGKLFPRLIVELCRRTHSFDDSNPRAARKGVVRCHHHHYRHQEPKHRHHQEPQHQGLRHHDDLHQVVLQPQVSVAHFSTSTWLAGGGHG